MVTGDQGLTQGLDDLALPRRFVVQDVIGRGGMGVVLRAHDRFLGRPVALKVAHDDGAGSGVDLARDARVAAEFGLLAELDHPGVVRVLDLGRVPGRGGPARWWMTSEIVEGPRLDRWLATTRPAPAVLERLVAELLATLGWLHARGLLHGDLKPANILVSSLGGAPWPVLLDFGLAGAFGAVHLGGTRSYLAPELVSGARPSATSELYALGVALDSVRAHSPALERLVSACTASDPALRPASARAALGVLGRAASIPRIGARDAATLWGDAVTGVADALSGPGVRVVSATDPPGFARAVAMQLAALPPDDGATWLIDAAEGLASWARLADAVAHAVEVPTAAPSDQREQLDAFADALVEAVSGARDARIIVSGLDRATPATRYVAARVLESRTLAAALLVVSDGLQLERGALEGATSTSVPAPDDAALTRFAAAHGVRWEGADEAVLATLRAAARLGGGALRGLFEAWAERGVILQREADFVVDRDAFARLGRWGDDLWQALWAGLTGPVRAVAGALHELGEATPDELARVAAPETVAPGLAELGAQGLLQRRDQSLALTPAMAEAIDARVIAIGLDAARSAAANGLLRTLDDGERGEARELALGRLLLADTPELAAGAFARAAHWAERTFDWARAGAHHLAAARAAIRSQTGSLAFGHASRALAALRAGGGGPLLEAALALVDEAAALTGDAELTLEARLLHARADLELGRPADALARIEALRTDARAAAWSARLRAELALVRGTALAREGRRAEARIDLDIAMALFEAAGDVHAVGRVANNLGILAFHDGELEAAAAAWARAARAKEATGDRRGQRIGLSNRGLALRERGRFAEAWAATDTALQLATTIGDMVGRATGHLARAQLALDLGLPERAEAELVAFDAAPWRPELVRGDGENVRTRLALARGDRHAAAERARATLATPFEAAVLAEAGALLLVADADHATRPPAVEGSAGGLQVLIEAAHVLAAARSGRWSEARPALAQVAARCLPTAPPAAMVALNALLDAASMLDQDEARALLRASIDATERARLEAIAAIGLEPARKLRNSSDSAPPTDRTERPDPSPVSVTTEIAIALLTQLGAHSLPDAGRWAHMLRAGADAARCELHPDAGPPSIDTSTARGDTRPRFSDLADARRLPFEAREPSGTLEAVGVRLPDAEASLFWSWPPGRGPRHVAPLTRAARVVDLALAVTRHRAARDELARQIASLEAAHHDEVTSLRDALEQSQSALELRYDYGGVVHRSPGMRRVLETLDKVTDRDLPVLVLGESGVGKELVARALHLNSPRKAKRFVAENCGAIPKDLFESQFFGHVRGAFTGALAPRQGLFEMADGGTLFLDEVGELPLEHQVKLLRVLQERKVRPVGGSREINVDFRLVAATNRDLEQLVKEGRFREDLFYRLAVVRVVVPPLRERKEDVVAIAEHLLETHSARLGRRPRLSPDAADRLQAYAWPGNVRELENEIMRALALCDGDVIKARHLSHAVQRANGSDSGSRPADARKAGAIEPLEVTLGRVEKDAILQALRHTAGQKAAAARLLGLSRPGLDAKLARHAIDARSLKRGPG